jgi:hypothetical protein
MRNVGAMTRTRALLAATATLAALITISAPGARGAAGPCVTSAPSGTCPSGARDYLDPRITMSNGYNSYTANNCWADPSCDQVLTSWGMGRWGVRAVQPAGNGSVRTGPEAQQQADNWCPAKRTWDSRLANACPGPDEDTPVSALRSLTSTYAESMPHTGGTIAEAAYDIWTSYASDIMVWLDVSHRCNPGAFGGTFLGTARISGMRFAVHRYGGPGAEIIFVLMNRRGTCAEHPRGTVDLLGVLRWVQDRGLARDLKLSLLDFTFEICSTGGVPEGFSVSRYSLTARA